MTASDSAELLWWFVTLAGATCAFKLLYLSSFYEEGLWGPVGGLAAAAGARALNSVLIFSRDILFVGLIVGAVYLVGRRLLRLSFNVLMLVPALLWLSLGAANMLSRQQLGTNLTWEVLEIAIFWSLSDPTVIGSFLSKQAMLFILLNLAWCAIPFFISMSIRTYGEGRREVQRFWTACAIALFSFVVIGAWALADPEAARTWWWLYLALLTAMAAAPYYLRLPLPWVGLAVGLRRIVLGAAVVLLVVSGAIQTAKMLESRAETPQAYESHIPVLIEALFASEPRGHQDMPAPSLDELRAQYRAVAHPAGAGPSGGELAVLPAERLRPRHILIFSLETAFQKFYRLSNDPSLPSLYRMSRTALVGDLHQTTSPLTARAGASIVSGLYPVRMSVDAAKNLRPDSLPIVLAERGYESTYIDSYILDWGGGPKQHALTYQGLGFDRMLDVTDVPGFDNSNKTFVERSRLEEVAFERVWTSLMEAEAKGRGAFVFLQTAIGHFPWLAAPGREGDSVATKIHAIAEVYDRLFGVLLARLEKAGLTDKVIIVVTGDHGLRTGAEFESLGLAVAHTDLAFNVALIISAPGLLDRQIAVPFVTSHADLAPTLLAMLGVPAEGLFHHGANILSGSAAKRVTYLFNTSLSPIDGYHWNGLYFTFDSMRGAAQVASDPARMDARPLADALASGAPIPDSLAKPDALLDAARGVFDQTIAYFLNRGAQATAARQ